MNFRYLILLVLCSIGIVLSPPRVDEWMSASHKAEQEVLYLPSGRALQALSFGHRNVLADVLWFKTISYFGAHFQTDKNYRWLSHMCTLVTDLDPYAEYAYRFCATMLSWELNSIDASNAILTKAIAAFPHNWFFPYLRGFNYFYFLKDNEKAKADLLEAARRPGVDPTIASLAAKKASELDNPEIAEMTIRGLIQMSSDENVRKALEKRLEELKFKKGNSK